MGEAAAASGVKLLFTSAPTTKVWEVDGCRVLGRYTLRQWSPAAQAAALASGSAAPRLQQWAFYSMLNVARTVAGEHYTRLRQWFWSTRSHGPRD